MTKIKAKDLCKVGQNGRVTIKKTLREIKGIEAGDFVWIDVYKIIHITNAEVKVRERTNENES